MYGEKSGRRPGTTRDNQLGQVKQKGNQSRLIIRLHLGPLSRRPPAEKTTADSMLTGGREAEHAALGQGIDRAEPFTRRTC